jgi:predicted glycosyltransferase
VTTSLELYEFVCGMVAKSIYTNLRQKMASVTQISKLAEIISSNTAMVDEYFKSKTLPPPSFNIDGPPSIMFPPGNQK